MAFAAMLLAGIAAWVISSQLPPTYRASVVLVATQAPSSFVGVELVTPPSVDPRVFQGALVEGDLIATVLRRVTGREHSEIEINEFRQRLRVNVENQLVSSVVRISVTDGDANRAATYANELARELVNWDRNRALSFIERGIGALELAIAELDSELVQASQPELGGEALARQAMLATLRDQRARELDAARARSASAVVVGGLSQLSPSAVPERAIGPRLVFNTFVAAVLGLVLAYLLQVIRWSQREEVRTQQRLVQLTGIPVIAEYPKVRASRSRDVGEAGSYLRTGILRELGNASRLVVGITSPSDFSEKLRVSSTLAEHFAVSGHKTLLIDGDLRKQGPGLGLEPDSWEVPGLSTYLMDPERPIQPLKVMLSNQRTFDMIPSIDSIGKSSELLEYGLQTLVIRLRDLYDVVIIDLPPVLKFADAVTAAAECSAVVVSVEVSSSAQPVKQSIQLLERNGGKVLGCVLIGVTSTHTKSGSTLIKTGSNAGRSVGTEPRGRPQKRGDAKAVVRVKQR